MNRSRHLVVMFCLSVFGVILPTAANAQSSAEVAPSTSFHGTNASQSQVASKANAVTVTGTIQDVLSKRKNGTNGSLNLVLAGPQGIVNASMGPYLTSEVKTALAKGTSVQVAGLSRTINGQNYVLVQELTVGSQKVTVRNENGSLIRPQSAATASARKGHTVTKGAN